MFEFLSKFKKNRIWSLAVYVEPAGFSFENKPRSVSFVLDSRKLRKKGKRHIHTYADPFLFPHNDELFLFYESQAVGEDGKIEAYKTSDLKEFEYVGEILKEPFHISFPFIFTDGSSIFLMPETLASNEISLYKFEEFPNKPVKLRVLLTGPYRDSFLIRHAGVWYLFTTSEDGLEIFYTDDLEKGNFVAHPKNPITNDPKYERCGGSVLAINDELYRIAQDCSSEYGKNINILKVKDLSKTNYDEEVLIDNYFNLDRSWNALGGHHLNIAEFKGKTVIAVDGKQFDLFMNKFLAVVHRF